MGGGGGGGRREVRTLKGQTRLTILHVCLPRSSGILLISKVNVSNMHLLRHGYIHVSTFEHFQENKVSLGTALHHEAVK